MGLVADFSALGKRVKLPRSLVSHFKDNTHQPQDERLAMPPHYYIKKPNNWATVLMPFEGSYVPTFIARAENETSIVGMSTGMSSTPLDPDWVERVDRLNARGISVVSIGLHHTANYDSYYKLNRRLVEAFFFDQTLSPLYQIGHQDINVNAITHSTSSALFLDTLSRKYGLERKPERLKSAIHLNPLLDTYHSSTHHPTKDWFFTAFMLARGSHEIGTHPIERKIIGAETVTTDHDPQYGRPEYARVYPTRNRVREFRESVLKGERADVSMFPQKIYLGSRDKLVCADTAAELGAYMGIETQIFDADHYKILNHDGALDDIQMRIERGNRADYQHRERGSGQNFMDELSRFGFSLEGRAGALDAGTSLA